MVFPGTKERAFERYTKRYKERNTGEYDIFPTELSEEDLAMLNKKSPRATSHRAEQRTRLKELEKPKDTE